MKNRSDFLLKYLLIAFCFSLVPATKSFAGTGEELPVVRVQSEIIACQVRLVLGDIAEVQSGNPEIAERLRKVSLGYAPNVGIVREIPRERIELAITASGLASGTFRLECSPVVLIRRAAQSIDPGVVREAIEHATLDELNASGATARLSRLELPTTIDAPAGKIDVRASMGNVRDIFSPFTVFVELWQEGTVVKRFNATAQIEAFAPVAVATRELITNTRLRQDCLKIEVRRLEKTLNNYITDPSRLRGMSVRKAVGRGDVITTDLLTADIVIRPGDQVRIIAESGSDARALQLIVLGEARAAGHIGDRIQVKNIQSGALLQAVVTDEGTVRVRF